MYVTAHRVWSREQRRDGIHAFVYRHSEPLKKPIDLEYVADFDPGELEASHVELPAGGNEVRSYLDVAADDLSAHDLTEILDRFVDVVRTKQLSVYSRFDGDVASRFYANPALIPSCADEALALSSVLRRLYERPRVKTPLLVHVDDQERGIRLSLDPDSGSRIREFVGPDWLAPPGLYIEHDTWIDFAATYGPILQHLLPVLTGLDTHQLEAIGGIRIVTRTGREVTLFTKQ